MDLRPGVGVGLQMCGKLLHPVFPAQADAGGDGGADGLIGLNLGGGAQGDLTGIAPCGAGGSGDFFLHGFDILG